MEDPIWYILPPNESEYIGPLEKEDIIALLDSEKITTDTYAWSPAYRARQWFKIKDLMTFKNYHTQTRVKKTNSKQLPKKYRESPWAELKHLFILNMDLFIELLSQNKKLLVSVFFVIPRYLLSLIFPSQITSGFNFVKGSKHSSWYDEYVVNPIKVPIPKRRERVKFTGEIKVSIPGFSSMAPEVTIGPHRAFLQKINHFYAPGVKVRLQIPLENEGNYMVIQGRISDEVVQNGKKYLLIDVSQSSKEITRLFEIAKTETKHRFPII